MRILISRPRAYTYSETFITNIITGLSEYADVYNIHSGRLPERREDGTLLNPRLFWVMHKLLKVLIGRNNYFANYGIKKFLLGHKIDVVFANFGQTAAHMTPICKTLKIPLIAIFHGRDASDKKLLSQYKNKYLELFSYASGIIAVSEEMKKKLIIAGASPDKVKVIPYGINVEKFKPNVTDQNKMGNILAVGRFIAKKGPLHTIKAFSRVLQKFPDVTLTMVGEKIELFDQCKKLVNELQIQDSVIFTGILSQEEIAKLMTNSLMFVQHSIVAPNGDSEGTPLSILEASASGLPVVSTLHGGIKEAVVHGKTGYLVEEKDEAEMAKYMILLCENPERGKEMGLNGRDHIQKNYQDKKQIKKIFALLQQAVMSQND